MVCFQTNFHFVFTLFVEYFHNSPKGTTKSITINCKCLALLLFFFNEPIWKCVQKHKYINIVTDKMQRWNKITVELRHKQIKCMIEKTLT